jgi:bifunctional DNase/RNase
VDDDLVLLTIVDVRVAVPAGNGIEAGLVVLEEEPEPHRQLRMYVGQPEARAIQVAWSNSVPPRPSTWDLFISTIALLDARIERVIITDVREERHYFAQMVVHRAEEATPLLLTARPSDAIALALRAFGARVFAQAHVLDEAGLLGDGSHWVRPAPEPAEETVATDDPDAGDGEPDLQEAYEGLIALAGTVGKPVDPEAARLNRDRAAAERAAAARSARSFGDRGPRDDGTPRPDGLD